MDVFDLTAKLTLDTSEYDKSLGEAETSTSSFGSVLSGIGGGLGMAFGTATAVLGTTATVITKGTKELVNSTMAVSEYGDNIDKMSQKMGISAEAYQEWDAVMQHSGTSMESLKASMKTLANAAEKDNEAFAALGITEEDLANMSNEDLFGAVITGLQNMEEGTERTYIASQLLGRGATELGALLNTSAEETQAMKDRVHELGGVMSDEAVKSAAQFQDNIQDLQTSFEGLKRNILSELLPGLNDLTAGFTDLMAGDDAGAEKFASGIEKLFEGFMNIGDKITNVALNIIPNIIKAVSEKFPDLIAAMAKAYPEIATSFLDSLTTVVIPTIVESLPNVINPLVDIYPELMNKAITMMEQYFPMLLELAVDIITTLGEGLAAAYPQMIPAIYGLMMTMTQLIIRNLDKIIEVALDIILALVEGMLDSMDEIVFGATAIILELAATIIKLLPVIIKVAVELISVLVAAIVENGIKLFNGDYFGQLLDTIIDVWQNIDWGEIGKNIIDGIVNGITKGWDKMKDSVKGVIDGIKGLFTDTFKIASPSKLFEYYGEMIDEGLAKGIDSGASVNATKNLSSDVTGAFNPSIAGAGGGDIIIPVSIGGELIQTLVVDALSIANYRSGGR